MISEWRSHTSRLIAKMAIRLIRANDGKRDSGNRKGSGMCAIDEREAAAGCGGPKDESPTVAVSRRIIARLNFLHKSRAKRSADMPLLRKRTEEDEERGGMGGGRGEESDWQDSKLSADRWGYNGY